MCITLQDNLGKFRIEEVTAPAGYTDAALQGTDWVEHWSQEFEITASDQTYSYTGDDADYNRPQGNKVIIKKIEAHTGEIIVDDAVFTLYQWNEERGLYEKAKTMPLFGTPRACTPSPACMMTGHSMKKATCTTRILCAMSEKIL